MLEVERPSPTLSGGAAQRIKLVTEPTKVRDDVTRRGNKVSHTLYVLDEPPVGLHMADVEKLIRVLHRLVDGGHSVVVIEHDLDVIAEADWVIDLGPEGGVKGGAVVGEGVPEGLVANVWSHTGAAAFRGCWRGLRQDFDSAFRRRLVPKVDDARSGNFGVNFAVTGQYPCV